jgi:hypothetical protein
MTIFCAPPEFGSSKWEHKARAMHSTYSSTTTIPCLVIWPTLRILGPWMADVEDACTYRLDHLGDHWMADVGNSGAMDGRRRELGAHG